METLPERVDEDAKTRQLPPGLWDRLRADPLRAPEYIALAAADRHGPAAEAWWRTSVAASPTARTSWR